MRLATVHQRYVALHTYAQAQHNNPSDNPKRGNHGRLRTVKTVESSNDSYIAHTVSPIADLLIYRLIILTVNEQETTDIEASAVQILNIRMALTVASESLNIAEACSVVIIALIIHQTLLLHHHAQSLRIQLMQ